MSKEHTPPSLSTVLIYGKSQAQDAILLRLTRMPALEEVPAGKLTKLAENIYEDVYASLMARGDCDYRDGKFYLRGTNIEYN